MKATAVLLQQHRHFEYLLAAMEHDPAPLVPLLGDIARQLDAHLRIKHEIFYPAIATIDPSLVLDRYEDHAVVALDLDALLATDPTSTVFRERVGELRAVLALHIDTEETFLYPQVEALLPRARLVALGAELSARFDELLRDEEVVDAPAKSEQRSRTASRVGGEHEITSRSSTAA